MGIGEGDQIAASLAMVGKRGRVVVTNLHRAAEMQVTMSALDLTLFEKQVRGSLFGSSNPRADIPRMLELHRSGKLKLQELRTRTYSLDDINVGYDDMRNGNNLRGVITF
jgi:S-(hydroxymethyl)glutathione dehydrogenase/alcohol dehydrogenase